MNTVNITGRLTHIPELKVAQSGKHYMGFQVAIDEGKDRNGNKITTFVRCKAWDKTADIMNDYSSKGSNLAISGSLKLEKYNDQERLYVNVERVEVLDHKKGDLNRQNEQNGYAPNMFGGDRSGLGNSIGLEDSDLEFY